MIYLLGNSDRLTEIDGYPVSYIKETDTRESRKFAVARIGHSFEHRYVTDQWIFIDSLSKQIYEYDIPNDSLILWTNLSDTLETQSILKDGKYTFDVAFAEHEGKSLGVKVDVLIHGNNIIVTYEGEGSLTADKGTILDQGYILKHKTGDWIITKDPKDSELDEIGGCTDGPSIIDFKNQKFWMC